MNRDFTEVPLTALLSPLPWPLIGANPVDAKQWGVLAAMMVRRFVD